MLNILQSCYYNCLKNDVKMFKDTYGLGLDI